MAVNGRAHHSPINARPRNFQMPLPKKPKSQNAKLISFQPGKAVKVQGGNNAQSGEPQDGEKCLSEKKKKTAKKKACSPSFFPQVREA